MYTLRWGPGDHAAQHDVYYGTDKAAVESASVTTPGIYKGRIGPNSLGPLAFDAATFYYWRVDEVNLAGPDPCVWKGSTWTFRTVGYGHGTDFWNNFVSALRIIDYDGAINIEHEDPLMSADEGFKKAVEFLNKVLLHEKPGEMWWA